MEDLAPADGGAELGGEEVLPLGRGGVGPGVDVGQDRQLGVAEVGFGQRLAQAFPGRGHERGVEGPADLEGKDPAGPQLLGVPAGRLDGFRGAGDDHLARRVVVGQPHVAVGGGAGHGDVVVVQGDDRRHGPGPLAGGDLHGLAPLGDQADAIGEGHHTGRGEGGVLTQAVAGDAGGIHAEALHGVEDDEAHDVGGELGVAGLPQLVGIGSQQQLGHVPAGDGGGLLDQLPRGVVLPRLAHAGLLGTLSREGECDHVGLPGAAIRVRPSAGGIGFIPAQGLRSGSCCFSSDRIRASRTAATTAANPTNPISQPTRSPYPSPSACGERGSNPQGPKATAF